MDGKILVEVARKLYDENLRTVLSILRENRSKYFILSLNEDGILLNMSPVKCLVKPAQSEVLLLKKKLSVSFGNGNSLVNEIQRKVIVAMEKDVNVMFGLSEVEYLAREKERGFLKEKVEKNMKVFGNRFGLRREDIPQSNIKEQKLVQIRKKRRDRRKKKFLKKLLSEVPDFNQILFQEKQRMNGNKKQVKVLDPMEKYFKYFYRLNNRRYQFIVVY